MHTKTRVLTGISLLFTILLMFGFAPNAYSAIGDKIELSPGETSTTTLKLENQIRVHGGILIEGVGGINVEGVFDDKIKFWITNPDGKHIHTAEIVDTSATFDFTTTEKGTYTFFYENSDALIGFKTITLSYNTQDLNPNPIEEIVDNGGGCLIATATYGSELAPQVQQLRELRDNTLLQTESGSAFMIGFNEFYYSFSPTVADLERQNPVFKEAVKLGITPLITSLSILNYVDIDSEVEVLGYGISLILLNVGMYFIAPAVVIHKIRKLS